MPRKTRRIKSIAQVEIVKDEYHHTIALGTLKRPDGEVELCEADIDDRHLKGSRACISMLLHDLRVNHPELYQQLMGKEGEE